MAVLESREMWGALPPKSDPGPFVSLDATVAHYTAADYGYAVPASGDHSRCREQVRSIQRQHQGIPDQSDIEYSHLGCNHGVVFVGRVPGIKTGANGTAQANKTMPSFCFLMGVNDVPSSALYAAAAWWHAEVEVQAGRSLLMYGHKQITSTSCPGDVIYPWVTAGGYRQAQPHPPKPVPPTGVDDMHLISPFENAQWVVAADLSSRTGIPTELDLSRLLETGRYIACTLSDVLMGSIPIAQ